MECEITDQSVKYLTKGQWPNLNELSLGKIVLDIGGNEGLTPQCLTHLEMVDWSLLEKVGTSFDNQLSIQYFATVVRMFPEYI